MGSANGVGDVLDGILMRCANEHPYHTLPVLLAQALMHKDKEYLRGGNKKPVEVILLLRNFISCSVFS